MDLDTISGQTALNIMESGLIIRLKVKEYILGLTAEDMMVNGKKIICMDMECTPGQMVVDTKEIMKMIKRMVKVLTSGQMEGITSEVGLAENNTAKESIF